MVYLTWNGEDKDGFIIQFNRNGTPLEFKTIEKSIYDKVLNLRYSRKPDASLNEAFKTMRRTR